MDQSATHETPGPASELTDEQLRDHFDHFTPGLPDHLYETLARLRSQCPVAHSDQHGGFWVATGYEEVLRIAQNWQTWSSELGYTVPKPTDMASTIIPLGIDPPLHRHFRRLINPYLTPVAVAEWEEPTRRLVNQLIDEFIERGECEFMADFAHPFPGTSFFELGLHAPTEDLAQLRQWTTMAGKTHLPEHREALGNIVGWIHKLMAVRRSEPRQDDVVDAILHAEIDGRPITEDEAVATISLLIFGGLETTAGMLGMAMHRFCQQPELADQLRQDPDLIPAAVEELLRIDGAVPALGRTARHDTELAGTPVKAGEQVLLYFVGANRDPAEFEDPDEFTIDRERNRHIAFGAGPHRCAGSNLARLNLRITLGELLRRLHDIELQDGATVGYHGVFNRQPLSLPITFTPGTRTQS